MLPESVKDPVGYLVSITRPGEESLTKGVVKGYNEHHNTLLVHFDDGEEAWFGIDDSVKFIQQSSFPPKKGIVESYPTPENPLQWKVRLKNGKKGLVVGFSAPLAQIRLDSGESVYVNIETQGVAFLYCTSIFQFETTPRRDDKLESTPLSHIGPLFAKQFDVTDVRLKLQTYHSILEHCQSSVAWQTQIGAELKTIENNHRRIHFVFQDLQAIDRGLRLAAARCICALAYENPANQDILSKENGLTMPWLRVFSIPSKFQQLYEQNCKDECRLPDQDGFIQYLHDIIQTHSAASVATAVYEFYNTKTHLPKLWCYPPIPDSLYEWSSVPDPEVHLIGYIKTLREVPPLSRSLSTSEVQDIASIFTRDKAVMALLKKAQSIRNSIEPPVNRFLLYDALHDHADLQIYLEDSPPLAGLVQTFELAASLTNTWGAAFVDELLRLFASLIPLKLDFICHDSWVWQSLLYKAMETNNVMNANHPFFELFDGTEAPLRLLTVLTHLRHVEAPREIASSAPLSSPPLKKPTKNNDHRISNAIASAQQAAQDLHAVQTRFHPESTFQRHLSDVNTITTYVHQTAQKLHNQMLQLSIPPTALLTPVCANLDEILTSVHETRLHSQQERHLIVQSNKERLQNAEKRSIAATIAKQLKWQQQCDAIQMERKRQQQVAALKHAEKLARVQQEREELERRHNQEMEKLEEKVAKIMCSPRLNNKPPVLKPHPPPPQKPQKPQQPPSRPQAAGGNRARPQSARLVRERTTVFGNMVAKIHAQDMLVKKEQSKAMWRQIRQEKKRFELSKGLELQDDIDNEVVKGIPEATKKMALDLPLSNNATCVQLASELLPPAVKPPSFDQTKANSYIITAKYNRTLDDTDRERFKARFSSNHVKLSHKLSFAVQEQYVQMARRNQAWSAFCASSTIYSDDPELLKRTEFANVARRLGMEIREAECEALCRRLDRRTSGFIAWRDFYEWFLDQDVQSTKSDAHRGTIVAKQK
ncbi:hypothetical protein AeMF1_018627 [Aphanomyces euteiches]|nr:hypothetical protein AeMF1_018627 [Aphanomyces euteiches]KAH9194427.1 hypothetical protein AeNC1_003608 [Aphanomyces euteiches]